MGHGAFGTRKNGPSNGKAEELFEDSAASRRGLRRTSHHGRKTYVLIRW
jgi:hypothetical protein